MSEDRSVLTRTATPSTRSIAYGPEPDQVIEQWWPVGTPTATLVFLHGGFWDQEYDRSHCAALASAVAEMGVVVMLPEYRRVGGSGGWPTTFVDVRDGVARACEDAPTKTILLAGHSAGGQLALWAAATQPDLPISAVIGLASVADLGEAHRLGLGGGAVSRLLGGPPATCPDRFAETDPVQLPAPLVPVTLIHGRGDSIVPKSLSRSYRETYPGTDLREPDCSHFELIDPSSAAFAWVLQQGPGFDQWSTADRKGQK